MASAVANPIASSCDAWLGSWFANSTIATQISEHLARGGLAQVSGFLEPGAARKLVAELRSSKIWQHAHREFEGFQYSYSQLKPRVNGVPRPMLDVDHPLLASLDRLLHSAEMHTFASDLLGGRFRIVDTRVQATRYRRGDYLTVHSDSNTDAKGTRRLAFVLNLSENWRPEWGGVLNFLQPWHMVLPSFNEMTLFAVGNDVEGAGLQQALHTVSPVSPAAPDDAWRLAVSGWFVSDEADNRWAAQREMERMRRELDVRNGFVLAVSG